MRGDRVEIVVDSGSGTLKYEIEATKAGRRVEVSTSRGVIEVTEVTRSGTAVRSGTAKGEYRLALGDGRDVDLVEQYEAYARLVTERLR